MCFSCDLNEVNRLGTATRPRRDYNYYCATILLASLAAFSFAFALTTSGASNGYVLYFCGAGFCYGILFFWSINHKKVEAFLLFTFIIIGASFALIFYLISGVFSAILYLIIFGACVCLIYGLWRRAKDKSLKKMVDKAARGQLDLEGNVTPPM